MAEYRHVPDEREDDFREITRYAFDAQSGPYDPDDEIDERLERLFSFGEKRGMFEGEDLLVVCKHLEFTARVRGEWLPMAGLTLVASPPEHRRQGYVGELLAGALAEYRDRGWPIAALHPFDEAFYARYGWATGYRRYRATVETAALSAAADAASDDGSFHRVRPGEYERLEPAYEAWLEGRNLATRRSADWWRDRVFQTYESELFCYCWERDGETRGYLVYGVDSADGGTLSVHEMASADPEAYLQLLRFAYNHDSQVETVELVGPDHDRLLDVVPDRSAVALELEAGKMVRIVDVPAALEAVPYPVDEAGVVVGVEDDHAPWNEATWAIEVDDGEATVRETGERPDAVLDIGALSQLLVGYGGVERARTTGTLVTDDAAAETLAALFPDRSAYLPEGF